MTTTLPDRSATAAPATDAHALTGKRRIAFAAFVDENYLPGFLALLRSLALSNPGVCEDFVVLHDDLKPGSIAKIRALHPRIVLRRVDADRYDTYKKGDQDNYLVRKAYFILDVFRLREYDTVITLDTDMVVLGDLGELLRLREGLAAVPQFFYGQHKLNSGLLVIQREYLSDEFCARLDRCSREGDYELDKHDQGILNSVLDGDFVRLDPRYNFVKRRLSGDLPVPEDTAILHFTGRRQALAGRRGRPTARRRTAGGSSSCPTPSSRPPTSPCPAASTRTSSSTTAPRTSGAPATSRPPARSPPRTSPPATTRTPWTS